MPTSNSKNIKSLQYSKDEQAFKDMEKILAKLGKARTRLALEQRLVFDAAAAATGAEVAADQVAQEQAELAVQQLSEGNSNNEGLNETSDPFYIRSDLLNHEGEAQSLENAQTSLNILSRSLADSLEEADGISLSLEPTEVLFIDSTVENVQDLLAAVPSNVEVFILDPSLDGVSQIATALEGRSGIDAIHIISHGDSAQLNLGSGIVTTNSIQGNHAQDLTEIGATLSTHGDILIYGCDFGAGEKGAQAVNLLAQATGADIAASDDVTGHEDLGGDWDLEVEKGQVEANALEAKEWNGALQALDISIPANAPVIEAVNADGQTTYTINNAGIVGGQSIDIRATVVSTTPGASISIYPSTGPINYGGDDILLVMNGAGDVEVRWDIFQSGTNQTVYAYGDPNFSIADLDGYGVGSPIETVSPSLNGITGYTLENNTTLQAQIAAGNVSVSGSANRNGQSDSMVTFHWRDVSSWNVIYTATSGGRHYLHDGNGDFTFVDSQTVYMLGIDLDANDSTAPNTSYAGGYTEGGRATVIIDSDFEINQHPILGKTIHEATITLTNAQIGDHLLVNESTNSIGTVRGLDYRIEEQNGTIRVIISGTATTQTYEDAIRNITFYTEGQNPDDTDRLINISVTNTTYGTTSNAALSTITVTPTNDAPIAVNDGLVSVLEDTPVSGNVLPNDSDVDGDTLVVSDFSVAGISGSFNAGQVATIPNVGALLINSDGSYTFTPTLNYTGAIPTATYTLSDGNGGTDTATLSFADIVNINDAPVAVDDGTVNVLEDMPVSGNVLPNDSDPDGDALSVSSFEIAGVAGSFTAGQTATIPNIGALLINADGTYTFTPAADYTGAIPIATYNITDGNGGSDTATLSFADIVNINDAPVATNDGLISVIEDTPVSGNVLPNDSDVDGDTLSVSGFSIAGLSGSFTAGQTATIPNVGTLQINADGSYSFNPALNYTGAIPTATYSITDGNGGTDTATLAFADITAVNDAPVAVDDTPLTVTAGGTVTIDVLPNDSDPDGDPLNVTHIIDPANASAPLAITVGNPVTLASGTQVSLLADGSLDITTAANMAETETLDYIISDGNGGTDNATVTLNRDNDGDGVADIIDLDDDNDGILDVDEGLSYFTTTLDQVSALPASAFVSGGGVIPDGTQGLRLSNTDGTYFLDLYQGSNSSAGAPFTFDTNSGRISSTGANVYGAGAGSGEVVEIVYTTLNSPNPFDLTTISILDIDSLTSGGGATNVRDAYVWSEAGTWTPQGSPAAAVVSVDTAAADDVGSFVIEDPDGNNVIANIGQFTQVTAIDDTLSDVLLNPAGDGNNHNAQFVFNEAQTTASLFAFNSGGSNMYWAFNPQLDVDIFRPVGLDTDGDGIANHLDLDSDNDGISDLIESGQNANIVDQNNDGIHDGAVDANGVPIAAGSNGVTPLDSDNDGIANMLDLDSDNDGIADAVEARPTAGYSSSTHGNNAANNGVNDDGLYVPVDTDGDGTADYLDLDSDNDVGSTNGGTDEQESGLNVGADNNGDGIGDGSGASYADPDGVVNNPSTDLYNQTGPTDEVGYREDNTPPETSGILDQSGLDAAVTTFDISGSFTDVDATDVLTYAATGLPTGLSIDSATGIISGTINPSASVTGTFPVTVTADDGNGGQVSTSFVWAITNPAPTAGNDSDSTAEDTAFSSTLVGNDNDPDGDTLTYSLINNVAHGTLELHPNGTYTYTPEANFNGNDSFSYQIDDGEGGTATATVNITIIPVNDAPETTGIIDQASNDAQAITPLHISSSFTDIEADTLTFNAVGLPTGLSIDPATGIISGIVDSSASVTGTFPVTVTADDGNGGQVSTSFNWVIANPAPIANNDVATTNEDTGFSSSVASNDIDPDGDSVAFSLIDNVSHGSLTFNPDGSYDYNPDPDFNGQDRFIYQVDDGEGGIATAIVIITVTPVNDAPIAVNDSVTTDENTATSGDITPAILGQDSDVDGDVLTIMEINGLSFTSGDPITLPSGAILTMTADGSYSYNPNGQFESLADGQSDTDYFTYRISDGAGGIDTAVVTITITGVNDNPNAVDDTNATDENTAVSGDLTPFNVVGQDSDVEPFDILSVSAINGDTAAIGSQITLPSGALLTVNADGSYDYSPQSGFNYLADGEQAQDRFTYTLSDGHGGIDTATVMIDITGVNDTPETAGIADQASNDSDPITLDISDRFSDIDQSDVLTFSAAGLPTGLSIDPTTGIITGVINASASVNGPFDTIITADDGQGAQVSTSFTWAVTNPAPVAGDDVETTDEDTAFNSTVAGNDSDPDGDKLTYNVVTDVANGTLNFNPDGSYNYQPNQDFNGQDSFSYLVDDGEGGTSTATVIITVTPINDAPVAIGFLNQTGQDGTLATLDISPSFSDVDADTLTYSAVGLPTGLSIDPTTGIITGTIDPSASLNISFDVTITADDGAGGNASTHFSWEIINPAPLAGDDTHTTDEDTAFTSTVSANDYDPDGDKLTYNVVTGVANGTLNFNPDGSYSYSPDQDFNGQDQFSYLVDDGEGGTSTATVIITVTPINDAPVTSGIADQSSNDSDITSFDITSSFSDVDPDTLTYSAVGLPTGLTLDPATGIIAGIIDPSASVNGPFNVIVTTDDGQGAQVSTNFIWAVANPAPIASDDVETTDEDTAFNSTVAPNDQDPDGDTLAYNVVSSVSHGTLSFNADGSYSYNPDQDFNGQDSFSYLVDDGEGGTSTATVIITVTSINDTPETTGITPQISNDAEAITPLDISSSFSDVDGDVLTYIATNLPTGLVLDPNTGIISGLIDPSASVDGPFAVIITADDGQGANISTSFTWEVANPAPIAGDDNETTDEDTAFNATVASNDSDPDGDALIYSVVNPTAHGTLSFNPDGSYSYNPDQDFNGEDRFSYSVDDGEGGVDTATVIITVTPINDAPVAINDDYSLEEDAVISGDLTPLTGSQDSDVDGDILTITHINGLEHANGQTITLPSGALLSVNTDGSYRYDSNGSFNGLAEGEIATDQFVYTLSDGQGGIDTATVSFTILGTNDAPIAVDDKNQTDQNNTAFGNLTPNTQGQDRDADVTDVLSIIQINGQDQTITQEIVLPSGARLTVNADGSYFYVPNHAFDHLAEGERSQDRFTYTLSDGQGGLDTATVVIDIIGVNDAPLSDSIANQSGNDAEAITPLDISNNFNDLDNTDILTYSVAGLPTGLSLDPATGTISGTIDPSASVSAPFAVTITADDGQGGTVSTSFTWDITNPAPIAGDDNETIDEDNALNSSVVGNDSDPDGDALTYSVVNSTTHGTLSFNPDGSYSYSPDQDFNGEDRFSYSVDDGEGGVDTATVIITVTPINDAPVSVGFIDQSGEDAENINLDISSIFSDVDHDALTYDVTVLPTGLSLDPATGMISGTIDPSASVSAPFAVTITADDGQGGTVSTSFTWDITNPAPIAGDDNETIDEDNALNSSVVGNDSDPDGDALTYSVVNSTTHGTLSFNPDGSYSYSPDQDFNGEDRFSYSVDDGEGGVDTATVIITVTPVNDAPVAVNDDYSLEEDVVISGDLTPLTGSQDSDVDGDVLTITSVNGQSYSDGQTLTLPSGALLNINANGSYDYNPNGQFNSLSQGQTATDRFTYTITDGQGGVDTATVSFTILGTNDSPVIVVDQNLSDLTGDDAQEITPLNVAATFGDPDQTDILTYSATGLPEGLSLDPQIGVLSGIINPSASQGGNDGVYTITITATDPHGATVNDQFDWAISNPAPVATDNSFTLAENANTTVIGNALSQDTGLGIDHDLDGDDLSIIPQSSVVGSTGGLFAIDAQGVISFNPNGAFDDLALGETRDSVMTYTLSDGQGGLDTAEITMTITGTNNTPMVLTDSEALDQSNNDGERIAPIDLSRSFLDVDRSDVLTFSAVGLPEGLSLDPQTGVLSGTIDPSASQGGNDGVYTITITATDPHGATVNDQFDWTITNPAPVAINDEINVLEGEDFSGNVITNSVTPDYDIDGDKINISAVNGDNSAVGSPIAGSHGGVFTVNEDGSYAFEAQQDFNHLSVGQTQTSTLEYTLSDGQGGTSTALITATITGVNSPVTLVDPYNPDQEIRDPNNIIPVQNVRDGATPETLSLRPYFTDVDQNTALHFSAQNLPEGLVLDAQSGEITGTLVSNASREGSYSVIVTATDEQGHHVSTILVYQVENPAPITEPDRFTLLEDSSATGDVSLNDHDLDGDRLTFSVFVNPDHGLVTMQSDGTFVYTPNQDFHGHDSFSYRVTDSDGATRFEIVDLIITSVNDSPVVVTQLDDQDHREGDVINLNIAPNFSDLESDNITYSEVGLPDGLTLNFNTGLITGRLTADAAQNGILNVEITADDGQGGSVSSSFIWSITPLPVIMDATPSTTVERSSLSFEQEENERVSIGGVSKEFAADGIIVSTLNGLKNLAGTFYYGSDQSSEGQNGQAGSQMVERVAHITGTSTKSWDAVGLTGFSMKMESGTQNALDKDSLGTNGHLIVETLVRQKTIYIEIKDDLKFADDRNVQNYQVTLANGQPLPSWLRLSDTNMLIGERPADSETIELHITANMNDGSKISKAITIQTKNGEIRAVQPKG